MNEEKAKAIIGDWLTPDGQLYHLDPYIDACSEGVSLDGGFTVEELEAIAWWMKNKLK